MSEGKIQANETLKFLAAAAHDLKTPLVYIRGAAAQLSLGEYDEVDSQRQLLNIEHSAQRLLSLVDSLIGATRADQEPLPLEPIEVAEAISLAVEEIRPYANQLGFSFKINCSRQLPPVLSHRLALKRIIFNLLDNAIKYTQDEPVIQIRARRDDNRVRVTVRDYGIGVRPSDLKQIWRLFGQAAEPSHALPGSSGLGLYIVSNLSRHISAELSLKSLSRGTSFFVRLPVARQLALF
ncbi:MAG TPA: HAMP domain-containing sensor histidine kinase [Candidatus Saccharimonadales bacterium]